MPSDILNSSHEPGALDLYRPCVGVALFNAEGQVWVGKRVAEPDHDLEYSWQMPQGGIDAGESPEEAALRELWEETGADRADIIAATDGWLTYDLPAHLLGNRKKGKFIGQKQKWFALRFLGKDEDFQLDLHEKPEFSAWKWVNLVEVPELIVPFKRDVYKKVVEMFRDVPERVSNG